MAKIGLFYTTDTGNTRKIAKRIKKQFAEDEIELFDMAKTTPEAMRGCEALIIGTPTLGDGELPDPLTEFLGHVEASHFEGKPVALFGLGDQVGYPAEFVDALGITYKKLKKLGVRFVGSWPAEGYEFEKSKALHDGEFVGLVLDQDNQADLTDERLEEWLDLVKPELLGVAVAD
ncbi:MAG TPA: flavodoxin [Candidatus Competibacteraceae bacterium]|nr:flavodoxin [Candidatus Competibacteraceae bacterium]MCP5133312.1 flavodoxin [Gammaproteobacteria bacterium]HPF57275.1 flavodoxin [Candidatus Competibacteraceae bacterium]HRY17910.1 flavodoxin [Candidatus Competibacteraceae bacterium]